MEAPQEAARLIAEAPRKFEQVLRRYADALNRSATTGRPVSFSVVVRPGGRATATLSPAEAGGISPKHDPLADARARGALRADALLRQPEMLSADELARRIGTSRVTVNAKRQRGILLGLSGATRGFRFPAWQLDADGRPFDSLEELHERLGGPWAVYRFLMQPHEELRGLTGLQALQRRRVPEALAAAESIARGAFR